MSCYAAPPSELQVEGDPSQLQHVEAQWTQTVGQQAAQKTGDAIKPKVCLNAPFHGSICALIRTSSRCWIWRIWRL
jgi:hypothetical protein